LKDSPINLPLTNRHELGLRVKPILVGGSQEAGIINATLAVPSYIQDANKHRFGE